MLMIAHQEVFLEEHANDFPDKPGAEDGFATSFSVANFFVFSSRSRACSSALFLFAMVCIALQALSLVATLRLSS